MKNNTLIEFDNVTKEYDLGSNTLKKLNNINFKINKGEFVIIYGPTGSGKHTMFSLLAGLEKASSGKIKINNNNLHLYNDDELSKYRFENISFLFNYYNFIPNLTILENIELLKDLVDVDFDPLDIICQLGFVGEENTYPHRLKENKYEKFISPNKKEKIILCGEPINSKYDYETIKYLSDLSKEKDTTIIMITHNKEITCMANKIINLKNGSIDEIFINKTPKIPAS
ncbi:MAG: ABC transporter ATP-binding protein [Methanosphaera stadtmanae]|nr:ABC transporter ATP-binding protein [Methanosphaera stadtmanae]